MKRVLQLGFLIIAVSMSFMAVSHASIGLRDGNTLPFLLLLGGTTAIGTGFGLAITALNAFAFEAFPGREDSAVVGLHVMQAGVGLSMFWGSVTVGRILFAWLALRINVRVLHVVAPLFVAIGFLALPLVDGQSLSFLMIVVAGLGASFYFPYTISLAQAENPRVAAAISGILVASIQLGAGLSTNAVGIISETVALGLIFQVLAVSGLVMMGLAFYLYLS